MNDDYRIKLEIFEGPIDLLLYLIRKNHFDIFDIPIALITEQYLEYLNMMKTLNLDVAGEFLTMAASLAEIKSKMLLPVDEEKSEEEQDPRSELVKRLLEYQRYKAAADELARRSQLGIHTFTKQQLPEELSKSEEVIEVSIFELIDAFKKVLEKYPSEIVKEIVRERITVAQKINELTERLKNVEVIQFNELFKEKVELSEIIATFLALLELIRLKLLKVIQPQHFGTIWIYPTEKLKEGFELQEGEIDGYK
jgi:segregation and condensation protein A